MRSWWALAVPAAMILTLLGELGLPTLFPALRASWFRLSLIALVAIGLGGAALWQRLRGRHASRALAETLVDGNSVTDEEEALSTRMREAVASLKRQAGGRRDYLYRRPWYVVIGPPGAGKTTALLNSGLSFPWSDAALRGVGGTRNLDFWFADEAVIVDTAGRYTTHDSDRTADAAGWERFLRLLRRVRPFEPINGVIVTFGLDDLVRYDRAELDAHIRAIRRRLSELGELLQVSVPVYFLLTKADLMAGFVEYFDDLSAEGRRAVLGATFDPTVPLDPAAVMIEFDRVTEALWLRSPKRLQDEPDQRRRGMIIAFPAQVAALRTRVAYLLDGAFRRDGETSPNLRGFYLASGTQEGTPLDSVLSSMATVFDAPHAAPRSKQGRSYFLNRLLAEVAFPEAGMVRAAPRLRRRRRRIAVAALCGALIVTAAAAGLWGTSFRRNRSLQDDLLVGATNVQDTVRRSGVDLVEVRDGDADFEQILPLLDQLRGLPGGFEAQVESGPSWRMRLGLFQRGHTETARQIYLETLQRVLLPRLLLRAERTMRDRQNSPADLYGPLKAYLMLGGYGPLDRAAVRAWAQEDWRTASITGADRADVRARLARHLDALLSDPDLGGAWAGRRAPLDGALIDYTRSSLQSLSLADRAYAVLRQRASASGHPDWRADAVLASGDRRAFRNGDAVLAASVPWFYTRQGYELSFRPELRQVDAELGRDLWVLGPDARSQSIRSQLPQVRSELAAAYARDYVAAWDAVLSTPQAADYFQDPIALGAVSRASSPLKVLVMEVVRNTRLGGEGPSADGGRIDAGQLIEAHFRPVAEFAGGDPASGAAPVDQLLKSIRAAAAASSASRVPGAGLGDGAVQAQFAAALGELSTVGVTAPPQLAPFVEQASRSGGGAAVRGARLSLEQDYGTSVLTVCSQAIEHKYPFERGAPRDVGTADMQRVFGVNGVVDGFVRGRLLPLIDTTTQPWRWRSSDPVGAGLDGASAVQLQKAASLGDLASGGLPLGVSLGELGGGVTALELSFGGANYRFEAGDRSPRAVIWNLSVQPAARLILFAGSREVRRFEANGAFALFRLVDQSAMANAGRTRVSARFAQGPQMGELLLDLPSTTNPFGPSGAFAFRCPRRL